MKKILAAFIALFPFWGFSAENQLDARPAGASAPGSRPVPVRIRQIGQKPAAEADKAVVTLTVEYNWGDGTGYQLLLDADATAYSGAVAYTYPLSKRTNLYAVGVYNNREIKAGWADTKVEQDQYQAFFGMVHKF